MDREELTQQLLETFDRVNTEKLLDNLKFSLKGENLLLAILYDLGGISTPSKLIENLDFTAARLSAITKSLEAKGFISKVQNEKDRRSTIITITDEGSAYFSELRQEILRNATSVIEQLGENDVNEFLRIIRKLTVIVDGMNSDKICTAK